MKENRKIFYTEMSYVFGILIIAMGGALLESTGFGVSIVVAPAYVIYLKVSTILPFFTFGMSVYCVQAILLIITSIIMGRFKISYIFSFVTAVIFGYVLDGCVFLVGFIPNESLIVRIVVYAIGLVGSAGGVAMIFHTYISPEAYEVMVMEISRKMHFSIDKVKTVYDCSSCLVAIILSFIFFGWWQFEGAKIGTVIGALVNGFLIGKWNKLYERIWIFEDKFKLRAKFENMGK